MSRSKIEWTEHTWNPVRGCSRVSEGCRNCYAERWAAGPYGAGSPVTGEKFAVFGNSGPRWTGKVELIESALDIPLRRKKPTTYFVNSMSDLFHESLADEAIDRVFSVMALCPQHTFQVLTKRAERMQKWAISWRGHFVFEYEAGKSTSRIWPLSNVRLGVSAEDQPTADARIPFLLQTPAVVRFVSLEPLLGPITFRWRSWAKGTQLEDGRILNDHLDALRGIHQVIVGGESGPGARPMNPDWVRSIRNQCGAAGVPFFFKQWGEWAPTFTGDVHPKIFQNVPAGDGTHHRMFRVGKKAAGRTLDGRTWDEQPRTS